MSRLPKYIALCGWPKSGKDEVAKIFATLLNARVIDDGAPLREAAPLLFGYDEELPYSQSGKSVEVDTPNSQITVRQTLGDLGKFLEDTYGIEFMSWRAIKETTRHPNPHFIFPSVRRSSASAFHKAGGIVVEIRRPGFDSSSHDFDWYDPTLVTHVIDNDGDLEDLRLKMLSFILRPSDFKVTQQ